MSEYQYYEFQAINARDAMPEGGKVTIETSNAHLDRNYAAQHHDVPAGQYAPAPAVSTLRNVHQMPVMRKKQYLSLTGQLAENFKPSRRAGIVEIDEKIVGDKRKSVRPADVIFDRSHAQGQIELIG